MNKIMLIDGNSIINRAFYAIPPLTNSAGEYTNAVYGFLNIFFRLCDEERPSHIAVAFDLPKPTFRHIKYGAYKAGRRQMPDELRPQIPLLKALLAKMNIAVYEREGYEADDILGTLAVKAEEDGFAVSVVSGDKDLLQLATERITIRIPRTRAGKTEVESYNAADVLEKMGVTPVEYIDVKALMGDASDNIPGVPGIGEKTATKIIQDYKTVENAIEHAADVKPKKASENLAAFSEQARLSRELALIVTDADIAIDFNEAHAPDIYNAEALAEVRRLEFKAMTERFAKKLMETGSGVQTAAIEKATDADCPAKTLIDSPEDLRGLISRLRGKDAIAVSLVWVGGDAAGLSVATDGIAAFVEHGLLDNCAEIFTLPSKKIMLDAKRDISYLRGRGFTVSNFTFDAGLAAYVLDATMGSYGYRDIARVFLGEEYPDPDELLGKGKNKKTISELTREQLTEYGAVCADIAYRSYDALDAELAFNRQDKLYYETELPLVEVLLDMESWGLGLDRAAIQEFGAKLDGVISVLTARIYELAGEEFNINSPAQLGHILFDKLGIKGGKKTSLGYSTAADELEKQTDKHPIIREVLDYRTHVKLKSTYVDGLFAVADPKTARVYSKFNQTVTTTGRLSSSEPNLQNIPVRLALGRELRKAFVPADGFVFLDGDYSQIELRVLAHLSDDETLIAAFREGQDIHRLTASQAFGIPFDSVTPEQRNNAKAVNFGIVYGISAFSLSQDLGITKAEADRYIAAYFERYPKVKVFLDKTVSDAREKGYAETIWGRRRKIPELKSHNYNQRSFGERAAMNMPVQGSAADIIKLAMIRVHRRLKERRLQSRLVLQVHDELLLEVRKDELTEVRVLVKTEMEQAVDLKVDMSADLSTGATWYDTKL